MQYTVGYTVPPVSGQHTYVTVMFCDSRLHHLLLLLIGPDCC